MTNLDVLYKTLREWRDRLPGTVEILSVSILSNGELLVSATWKNGPFGFYVTEQEINTAYGLEEVGERPV